MIIDEGWSCRYPILGFILLSLCLISVIAALVSQLPSHNPYSCDTRDGVYLAMIENADDWQKTFTESQKNRWPTYAIRFEVPGVTVGYDVRPDSLRDIDVFYVSTHPGWPNNLWGSRGYLYVFDHSGLSWWEEHFTVQHLSGPVYCYSK